MRKFTFAISSTDELLVM